VRASTATGEGAAMSDCEGAPALYIPLWEDAPKGPRFLLTVMALWADARGSIDCSEEELAAFTGYELKAVARHLKWSLEAGLVSRSERRRRADGTLSGYRYWLSEKLNGLRARWTLHGAADAGEEAAVAGAAADTRFSSATRHPVRAATGHSGESTRHSGSAADKMPGGAVESTRARAGATFLFPSSFISFPWRDDAQRIQAEAVLRACGPGLGDPDRQARVLESLAYVLAGPWTAFDFAADVLPTVTRRTDERRKSKLWDFALLTQDIERYRAKRLRPVAGAGPSAETRFAPVAMPDAQKRAWRMAGLRNLIAGLDRGERPAFVLSREEQRLVGDEREAAFVRARDAAARELARLAAEA
jgi:hypothetical protein